MSLYTDFKKRGFETNPRQGAHHEIPIDPICVTGESAYLLCQ